MPTNEKPVVAASRETIPQTLLNRIENEWQQIRSGQSMAPRFEMRFTPGSNG